MKHVACTLLTASFLFSAVACNSELPPELSGVAIQAPDRDNAVPRLSRDTLLDQAEAAAKNGDWDQAIDFADRLLRKDSGNMKALLLRARAHDEQCDLLKALADLNRILDHDPRNASALCHRSKINAEAGAFGNALSDVAFAMECWPENAETRIASANLILEQAGFNDRFGEKEVFSKAIECLNMAVRLDAKMMTAYYLRSRILLEVNDFENAAIDIAKLKELGPASREYYKGEAHYKMAIGQPLEAVEHFEELLRQPGKRDKVAGHLGLAEYYFTAKDMAMAASELNRCVSLRNSPAMVLKRGRFFEEESEFDLAAADYSQVLKTAKQNESVLCRRGHCFARRFRPLEAIADFSDALRLNPHCGVANELRGEAYLATGKVAEAAKELTVAIGANGAYAHNYFLRGHCDLLMGHFDLAVADYSRFLDLSLHVAEPKLEDVRDAAKAYTGRGIAFMLLKEYPKAIADMEEAVRREPLNGASLYLRSLAYYEANRIETAKRLLDTLIANYPNEPLSWSLSGAIRLKLGEHGEADADFGKARGLAVESRRVFLAKCNLSIQRSPTNVMSYVYRSRLMLDEGKTKDAISDCARALHLDPNCWMALSNRAEALCDIEPDKALADCERGISLNPRNVMFWLTGSKAHFRKMELAEAIRYIDEADKLRPEMAALYQQRTEILRALDRMGEADACLKIAERLRAVPLVSVEDLRMEFNCRHFAMTESQEETLPPPDIPRAKYEIPPPPPS